MTIKTITLAAWTLAMVAGVAAQASAQEAAQEPAQTPATTTVATRVERAAADPAPTRLAELDVDAGGEVVRLELEQAIALALERNLSLRIERYRHSRSLFGILRGRGIYDFQIDGLVSTASDTTPTSSTLEQAAILTNETEFGSLSFSQLIPSGATTELAFDNVRFESTNLNIDPNPVFDLDLDFTVVQPLLRDFGRLATERDLIVARTDAAISREDFETQVMAIIQLVSDTYWDLVEAREQLRVAEESLALAENLHEMNRIQVRIGTKAGLETVQSEAGVAARQEALILLRTQVEDAADTLRLLINLEDHDAWDVEIVPATEPAAEHRPIDVREAIEIAYAERPDLRRQRLANETRALDARIARRELLPRLDLGATYGYNAIAGDSLVFDDDGIVRDANGDPVRTPGSYDDAIDQLRDGVFDGWRVFLQLSYPLQNRDARGRSAQAQLEREQGELELRQLELEVLREVRATARALEAAAQRIASAEHASELAKRTLEAEQKRYENGLSNSFEVLRIQEDLSTARRREVSAIVNYRRARTDYYRSIGRLLEQHGIVLAEDPS